MATFQGCSVHGIFPGLGTGGMIYYVVTIATVIYTSHECQEISLLAHSITGIGFIGLEIALLLKYSKVYMALQ